MSVLVTGCAGFIGYHLSRVLLQSGCEVVGLDNVNDYYDVRLKEGRLADLASSEKFVFYREDLTDIAMLKWLFDRHDLDQVCHLGAQAGVRHSLNSPQAYVDSNITGTLNIFECCRSHPVRHVLFASSSSVYGNRSSEPFAASVPADHPVSLYAATKRSAEMLAHTYAHLFKIPCTGLRFFTVYGPWGRPDMAYYSFTERLLNGQPITLFNQGKMRRDFTYVDDVVESMVRLLDHPPGHGEGADGVDRAKAPWRIFNIGNSTPVDLQEFVTTLAEICEVDPAIEYAPLQPGDVLVTAADCGPLEDLVGFRPKTELRAGLQRFVDWYREWSGI